jgi:hypothetical protein
MHVAKLAENAASGVNTVVLAIGPALSGRSTRLWGPSFDTLPAQLGRKGVAAQMLERVVADRLTAEDTISIEAFDFGHGEQLRDLCNFGAIDKRHKVRNHPRLGASVDNLACLTFNADAAGVEAAAETIQDAARVRSVGVPFGQPSATTMVVRVTIRSEACGYSSHAFIDAAAHERFCEHKLPVPAPEAANAQAALRECIEGFAADGKQWEKRWKRSPLTQMLRATFSGGHCRWLTLLCLPERVASEEIVHDLFALGSTLRQLPLTGRPAGDPRASVLAEIQDEMETAKHQLKLLDDGLPVPSGMSKPELLQQLVDATELFQETTESAEEMLAKTGVYAKKRKTTKGKWANVPGHPFHTPNSGAAPFLTSVSIEGDQAFLQLPSCGAASSGIPLTDAITLCVDPSHRRVVVKTAAMAAPEEGEGEDASPADKKPSLAALMVNGDPVKAGDEMRLRSGDRLLAADASAAWVLCLPPPWQRESLFSPMHGPFEPSDPRPECAALVAALTESQNNGEVDAAALHRAQVLTAFYPCALSMPASATWSFRDVKGEADRREKDRQEAAAAEARRREEAARKAREAAEAEARAKAEEEERLRLEAEAEARRVAEEEAAVRQRQQEEEKAAAAAAAGGATPPAAAGSGAATPAAGANGMSAAAILAQLNDGFDDDDDDEASLDEFDIQVPPRAGDTKPPGADAAAADGDGQAVEEEEEEEEEEPPAPAPRFDPVAAALEDLDRMLEAYRARTADAFLWKPDGPTIPSDLDQIMDLPSLDDARAAAGKAKDAGDLAVHDSGAEEARVWKLRTRRNIFNRGGAEPVHLLLSGRFLVYFPEAPSGATTASGQCYVYGATVSAVEGSREGRRYILQIEPSTPRKGTKDRSGPTSENDLFLSFASEIERDRWLGLLRRAAKPPVPEFLRDLFGDDVPATDVRPVAEPTLDRNDARMTLTKGDIDLIDEFLAMDETNLEAHGESEADQELIQPVAEIVVGLTSEEDAFDPTWLDALLADAQRAVTSADHDVAGIMRKQAIAADDGDDAAIDIQQPFWLPRRQRLYHFARTSTEAQAAAKIQKRGRAWLVNSVKGTVELVDANAKIAFVFSTTQVMSAGRLANNATGAIITVNHDGGALPFKEYFMTHADRELFLDVLNSARPALRLFAPSLVPGGLEEAVREIKVSKLPVGQNGKVILDGNAYLRVTKELHENIRVWVGTVNANGLPFSGPGAIDKWLPLDAGKHDIYAVTIQGVVDEPVASVPLLAQRLQTRCVDVGCNGDFVVLRHVRCGDVVLVVLVRRVHVPKLTNVEVSTCPSQISAVAGERGGAGIALRYLNTSFAFVAVHLPGQPQRHDLRRYICAEVLSTMQLGDTDCDVCNDFDNVFVCGDFNFPVAARQQKNLRAALKAAADAAAEGTEEGQEKTNKAVAEAAALADVLTVERKARRMLVGFSEGEISFAPTAPIDPANPSETLWIDAPDKTPIGNGVTRYSGRVLWRSRRPEDVQCIEYAASFGWAASGHRPVHGEYAVRCVRQALTAYEAPPTHTIAAAAPMGKRIVLHLSDIVLRRTLQEDVQRDCDVVLRFTCPGAGLFDPVEVSDPTCVQTGKWVYHDVDCVTRTHSIPLVGASSIAVAVLQVPRSAVRGPAGPTASTPTATQVKVMMSGAIHLDAELLGGAAQGLAEATAETTKEVTFPMQRGGQFITMATLMLSTSIQQQQQ